MRRTIWISFFIFNFVFLIAGAAGSDWLHWRGPEETGASAETNLPDTFSLDPNAPDSNLLWKVPYGCRSTPLVMAGKVYVIGDDGEGNREGERVMAFDVANGKVLWEHKFNVFLCDMVSSRVGWTNLAADPTTHRVYAHGTQGFLLCLDGDTGKVVWQRSLTEEFGRVTGYGGRSVSPTVDGDLVIIGMINSSWGDQARGGNRYAAFDKNTGELVWWSEPAETMKGTYYSNPIVKEVNGQRLLITGLADGELAALQVRTGVKVWGYHFGANVINASPVMEGAYVYCSHGEENPDTAENGRVICVDASAVADGHPKLVWEVVGIKGGLASPCVHGGRLYVPDDHAMLHCLDAKTGKRLWKQKYGTVARGSPVWADGKIYIAAVNAHFSILRDDGSRCRVLHDQFFPSKRGEGSIEINSTPAVADGKVIFGTRDDLYCLAKKGSAGPATLQISPRSALANTAAIAQVAGANGEPARGTPAHAQLVPADVTLAPGGSVAFKLRLFDKDGNFISESPAEWSLPSPPKTPAGMQPPPLKGEIKDGLLTVAKEPPGQQGYVEAKANGSTARARVRVAPHLPYKNDFEKVPVGATPGGWVNCQGKFAVVDLNGNKVLKKLANDSRPPLSKAHAYIGPPTMKDYVIQADLSATYKNNTLPDMGIVNCRYSLVLTNKRELRLASWEAQHRIDAAVPFPWKPGEWYRCKLEVVPQGDSAVVHGKVWPRDQPEPAAWTIEVTDPRPNHEGSPALYGYAQGILDEVGGAGAIGAEAYYDNVSITPR